jgi:hypothetical protein
MSHIHVLFLLLVVGLLLVVRLLFVNDFETALFLLFAAGFSRVTLFPVGLDYRGVLVLEVIRQGMRLRNQDVRPHLCANSHVVGLQIQRLLGAALEGDGATAQHLQSKRMPTRHEYAHGIPRIL